MTKINAAFLVALFVLTVPISVVATDRIYTGLFNNTAVGGYDSVSFFDPSGPVISSPRWEL